MSKGHKEYARTRVENATDLEAIVILYDEIVKHLNLAKDYYEQKNDDFKKEIDQARTVIRGLMLLLNFEKGGEVAQNLYQLYNYSDKRLVVAREGVRATPVYCDEIIGMLTPLRDSWNTLAEDDRRSREEQKKQVPISGHLEISI